MAGWTNPKTWLAAVLTVLDMNTHVRDNLAFLKANIALDAAVELTISAGGAVAKTKTYHTITVNGGAGSGNDDLVTCTGGAEGEILILKATTSGATNIVTVKDGSGADTFILAGDFAMDHVDDRLMLIHNGVEWVELSRSANS